MIKNRVSLILVCVCLIGGVSDAQAKAKKKPAEPQLEKNIIVEEHEGVKYYISLPRGIVKDGKLTGKKVKGVIMSVPFSFTRTSIVNDNVGAKGRMSRYLREGYALLCWVSPAQSENLDADIDAAYGVNTNDLSSEMAALRKKRWSPWLPKIDAGLEKVISKYSLPKNGYIAFTHCLSSERLCRYIDYKPERFSALLTNRAMGMYAPNEKTRHIYNVLFISPGNIKDMTSNTYSTHNESIKRFSYECYRTGNLYSVQYFPSGKSGKQAWLDTIHYLLQVRTKMGLKGDLTEEQKQAFVAQIRIDLGKSPYAYDFMEMKTSTKGGEDLISHEAFISKIPSKKLYTYWKVKK